MSQSTHKVVPDFCLYRAIFFPMRTFFLVSPGIFPIDTGKDFFPKKPYNKSEITAIPQKVLSPHAKMICNLTNRSLCDATTYCSSSLHPNGAFLEERRVCLYSYLLLFFFCIWDTYTPGGERIN